MPRARVEHLAEVFERYYHLRRNTETKSACAAARRRRVAAVARRLVREVDGRRFPALGWGLGALLELLQRCQDLNAVQFGFAFADTGNLQQFGD